MESIDQLKLRRICGLLAILIIPVCWLLSLIGEPWEYGFVRAYSDFYWTNARNLFVGGISILAITHLLYPGYTWVDKLINISTAICIYLVVVFPCYNDDFAKNGFQNTFNFFPMLDPFKVSDFHRVVGTGSLAFQAINVGFMFTRHSGEMTKQKKIRNAIYYGTAAIAALLFLVVFCMAAFGVWDIPEVPCFILYIQVTCFILIGTCWLIKGEAFSILNDK